MTPPLRRLLSRHRRALAAVLVAAAVLVGLASVAPPRPPVRAVVVAARDLAAGALLGADDLRVASLPVAVAPEGALSDPAELAGRALAGAVRRGEPLTDLRLVGPGLLTGSTGLVVAPVRLADADAVALVRPGDVIDVLAAAGPDVGLTGAGQDHSAHLVAIGARVLAVPLPAGGAPGAGGAGGSTSGALVVLAVTTSTARDLAGAAADERLSFVIEPDGTAQ